MDSKEKKSARMKALRDKRLAQGKCVRCEGPRAVTFWGTLGIFCESCLRKSRSRWVKRPRALLPLDAFESLEPERLAYAAGLIDGEGHIGFHKAMSKGRRRNYPLIVVRMTEREPVEFLSSLFGGKVGTVKLKPTPNTKATLAYSWQAVGRKAGAVACALIPFLISVNKIKRAELAIRAGSVIGLYTHWDELKNPKVGAQVESLQREMKGMTRRRKQ